MTIKILIQNFNELQIWVSHMWGLKVISTFIRNYVHLFSFIKSSYRKIWKWRYLRFWRKITSTGLRRQSLLNNTTTGPLIVALYTKKVLLVSGTRDKFSLEEVTILFLNIPNVVIGQCLTVMAWVAVRGGTILLFFWKNVTGCTLSWCFFF